MSVKTHKNTAKIDCWWAIGLLFAEGIAFVTKIENYPKNVFIGNREKSFSILKARELLMIMLLACS